MRYFLYFRNENENQESCLFCMKQMFLHGQVQILSSNIMWDSILCSYKVIPRIYPIKTELKRKSICFRLLQPLHFVMSFCRQAYATDMIGVQERSCFCCRYKWKHEREHNGGYKEYSRCRPIKAWSRWIIWNNWI